MERYMRILFPAKEKQHMGRKGKKHKEQQRQERVCVYCGKSSLCTLDHAIPRALFANPLPSNMITIPACRSCNQKKGELDTYLRDLLTADLWTYENPQARAVLEQKVRPSVRRNRSLVWRAAATRSRMVSLHTPGGIYLGDLPAVPFDGKRLNLALSMITRGLYFKVFWARLPDDSRLDIGRVDPLLVMELWDRLVQPGCNGPFAIDSNVFWFMFLVHSTEPLLMHWLFGFYCSIFFVVTAQAHETVATPPAPVVRG
jgi:hypothetical protein